MAKYCGLRIPPSNRKKGRKVLLTSHVFFLSLIDAMGNSCILVMEIRNNFANILIKVTNSTCLAVNVAEEFSRVLQHAH